MNPSLPQSCDDIRERILTRLEAGSDDPVCADVSTHLTECQPCRMYDQEMAVILGSLRELELEQPPEDLTDRIMARVSAEAPVRVLPAEGNVIPMASRSPFARKPVTIAAAVTLLALAVPFALQLGGGPDSPQPRMAQQAEQLATVPRTTTVAPATNAVQAEGDTNNVSQGPAKEVAIGTAGTEAAHPVGATGASSGQTAAHPVAPKVKLATSTTARPQQELSSDELLIATALPDNAFAGEAEDDPYYDPLSEWVGF